MQNMIPYETLVETKDREIQELEDQLEKLEKGDQSSIMLDESQNDSIMIRR